MLPLRAARIYQNLLRLACYLRFYPFVYNTTTNRLERAGKLHWFFHNLHRIAVTYGTFFCISRLMYTLSLRGHFPLLPKILNIAWCGVYTLAAIAYTGIANNEMDIMNYANWVLEEVNKKQISANMTKRERHAERRLGRYLMMGILLFSVNPAVHANLVSEAPCSPHFTSSLFYDCAGFRELNIPFHVHLPFMAIEYYMMTNMLITLTFNWSITFLGLSWILADIRKLA